MPPLLEAEADCLTAEAEQDAWEASNTHWNLPYFGLCRNTSCVRERYSQRRWEAEHQDILAEERDRERASAEERCAADE